ncbi:MAG: hypothetical protein K8T26_04130 [Lentisphaerae bacterium]|nr:hypothetical protein [Lentisphaerota bacterium]
MPTTAVRRKVGAAEPVAGHGHGKTTFTPRHPGAYAARTNRFRRERSESQWEPFPQAGGHDVDADPPAVYLDVEPETGRWYPRAGALGNRVLVDSIAEEDAEGRTYDQTSVEGGVQAAEIDQMIVAAEAQQQEDNL